MSQSPYEHTSQTKGSMSQARMEAAKRQIANLGSHSRAAFNPNLSQSRATGGGEELGESFLTMTQSEVQDFYKQYVSQLQEADEEERKRNVLSPISETASEKFTTIDTKNQTARPPRANPDDERKLTGKGTYNIEEYEYDHDYYSDDFESDEEDDASSVQTSGCSGTTAETSASASQRQETQAHELERVVQAYNMILESTDGDDFDFEQYKPSSPEPRAIPAIHPNDLVLSAAHGTQLQEVPARSLAHSDS